MVTARSRLLVPTLAGIVAVSAVPASAQDAESRVVVTLSELGCEPSSIQVPAGPVVFQITNLGGDVGEFEILEGDFVVDEVEDIVPQIRTDLVSRLDSGDYQIVCYTLQAPRGTLTVTSGTAASRPPSVVVDADTLAAYETEYEGYVRAQAAAFVEAVAGFVGAIKAGDLETARSLYAPSRVGWESIEPIAESFSDLDQAIDSREEDFPGGFDDPAFTGFHRIERILWVEGAAGDLDALADGLLADANDLAARLATVPIDAYQMTQGAGALIDEVARSQLTGEEDRYSRTGLWSIRAAIDGSRRIVDIVRPSLQAVDPAYAQRLDAAFAAIDALTDEYRTADGFQPFTAITPEDLTAMREALAGLAELLGQLSGTLGLSA